MPLSTNLLPIASWTARRGAVVRFVAAALVFGVAGGGLATECKASLVLPGSLTASDTWEHAAWTDEEDRGATCTEATAVVLELPRPQNDWECLLSQLGKLTPSLPSQDAGSAPGGVGSHSTSSFAMHHALSLPEFLPLVGEVAVSDWADVPVGFRVDLLRPPRA